MNEKIKRNLSGIYFRHKNEKTGKIENIVFEDLPEERQDEILKEKDKEWLINMVKQLSNTINSIGNQLDLTIE